jgi:hypothetical protein
VGITGLTVRITHPFHPLSGHQFDLVCHRHHWGEDRVVYVGHDGQLRSVAANLTDLDPLDDFQRIAAGTAAFRPADLLALSALLDHLVELMEPDDV